VNALRLFRPERFTMFDGTTMKIGVSAHIPSSDWLGRRSLFGCATLKWLRRPQWPLSAQGLTKS
jgi:hypothetical protein